MEVVKSSSELGGDLPKAGRRVSWYPQDYR